MGKEHLKNIQNGLSPAQRLYQIVEHGMCIGCGICQSVAGPNIIKMKLVENGYFRPIASGELSHCDMDRVMDVCPGTRVEGLPDWQVDKDSLHDKVWGVWREAYFSWSAEPDVRHMASTGGLLTGLGLYLIESGEVDFILHACEPAEHPTFGERFISRSRDDVLKAAGSRYGPTATLIDVVEVINQAEKDNQKFAFIGTPCDVSALRNYATGDERVDQICLYMLTMVCGGFMEPVGTRKFVKKYDVEFDDITSMRYRGYGCPGPTRIETRDGRVVEKNYLDYWGEDETTWGLPPRCKICPDGIGDAADVAAADTWPGGSPSWENQDSDLGSNAAIVRSRRGVKLMNRAIQAGYISRGEDLTPEQLSEFQPHQETKKRSVWARFKGMEQAGNIVPDTRGLRLEELYRENQEQVNEIQTEGTNTRIQQGKFSEPTPVAK